MNKDEAKKFYEQSIGGLFVYFDSYYKYVFYLSGENENITLELYIGGSADDIYRLDIDKGGRELPMPFEELLNQYSGGTITDRSTKAEYKWDNY